MELKSGSVDWSIVTQLIIATMTLMLVTAGASAVAASGASEVGITNGTADGDGQWNHPRHDSSRTGFAPEQTGPSGKPETLWKPKKTNDKSVAARQSVVGNGIVFQTAGTDLVAFSLATGEKLWTRDLGAPSLPAVRDGTVYVANDYRILALDAITGEEKWTFEEENMFAMAASAPIVTDDGIYVTNSGGMVFLLSHAGEKRWSWQGNSNIDHPPAVSSGKVYVALDTSVAALDSGGNQVWHNTSFSPKTGPVVRDGRLVFGVREGVVAMDAGTGQVEWQRSLEETPTSPPVLTGKRAYVATEKRLHAFDAGTGDTQWSVAESKIKSVVVAGDTLYFGTEDFTSDDNALYAYDAKTGKQRWRYETGTVAGAPAVVGGALVFDGQGRVHALGTYTGPTAPTDGDGDRSSSDSGASSDGGSSAGDDVASTTDGQDGASSPTDAPLPWQGPTIIALVVVVLVGIARGVVDSE